ncbi:MAG: hypothetical protein EAZ42_04790 [Verrucomicrobia bacterium]|nr:MAG: hypothetical protein EAZ42_04790 [Verrucomicrobiota bacterium]
MKSLETSEFLSICNSVSPSFQI